MSNRTNNIILNTIVTRVVYIVFVFAVYLFFTGHNAPGGGFIAGLMTACGIVLLYVTNGSSFLKEKLHYDMKMLIPFGLFFAVGCGLGGVVFGDPFLAHTFFHVHLPFFGDIEFATAAIFDFGVYLCVVGGVSTIITSIGEHKGYLHQ